MVQQIINLARQAKKCIMKTWGMKSGKQYRKWVKKERKNDKEEKC